MAVLRASGLCWAAACNCTAGRDGPSAYIRLKDTERGSLALRPNPPTYSASYALADLYRRISGLMTRSALLCLLILLLTATALLVALNACGTPTTSRRLGQGKLLHIVIVVQENRTPDNLFHDPVLMARGADIASIASTSSGAPRFRLSPCPSGGI